MLKEALLVLSLALAPASAYHLTRPYEEASPYCEGWEKGYQAGWCYQEPMCFPPMAPACPFPKFGLDTYQDGYNRGFVRGREDRDGQ